MAEQKAYKIAVFFPPWYSLLTKTMESLLDIRGIRHHCEFRNFISSDFSQPVKIPDNYVPDGILTSYDEANFDASWLDDFGVPIVNIFPNRNNSHPSVYTSYRSQAELIVSHFKTLNFPEIGLLKTEDSQASNEFSALLQDIAKQNNIEFWEEAIPDGVPVGAWGVIEKSAPNLKNRLLNNDQRCGIYTTHDVRARLVTEYVTELGLKVPEQVGILGRFNSLNARLSTPEISSLVMPTKKIALHAIQLMVNLIEGTEIENRHIEIEIEQIRARESTLGKNHQDLSILKARQIILEEACNALTVSSLLKKFSIARSSFEKRYFALFGITAAQDIRLTRVNRARELLLTTRYNIEQIARQTGFQDPRPFVVFFKRETGLTPGKFRAEHASNSS